LLGFTINSHRLEIPMFGWVIRESLTSNLFPFMLGAWSGNMAYYRLPNQLSCQISSLICNTFSLPFESSQGFPIWAMVGFLHRVVCNTHLISYPLGIHLLRSHMTLNMGGPLMHWETLLHPLLKKSIFFIHGIDLLSMCWPNLVQS